jgi:hypothetical protein
MRLDPATWVTWTALALGSALPAIVWRWVIGEPPAAWLPGAQALALAAALPLLGRAASRRPLRGFVLALAALQLGLLLATLIRELPLYADWAKDAPEYQIVFVSAFLLLIPGLLMLLSALLDGLGRGDLFLERGQVAAPSLSRERSARSAGVGSAPS